MQESLDAKGAIGMRPHCWRWYYHSYHPRPMMKLYQLEPGTGLWKHYFCEHCGLEAAFEVSAKLDASIETKISELLGVLTSNVLGAPVDCGDVTARLRTHKWEVVLMMDMVINNRAYSGGGFHLNEEFVLEDLQLAFIGFSDYLKCKRCGLMIIMIPLTSWKHGNGKTLTKRISMYSNEYSTCNRRMMRRALR